MSERIERTEEYVRGHMTDTEKQLFEQEMNDDVVLRKEVEKFRLIDAALEVSVEDDLRARLKHLESISTETSTPATKVRKLYSQIAVAAGILILISAGLWLLIGRGSDRLHQFSAENYLGYDYTQMRGEYTTRSDFPFDLAGGKYDKQKAASWLLAWLETHPEDVQAHYILADIYKDLNQPGKAKEQLAIIIARHSILWGEKAEWNYVLLCALHEWDELGKTTLQKMIQDAEHSYHTRAVELDALMKK